MPDKRRLPDSDFDLLSAYVDGALSDSERQTFENRLNREPELQSELSDLRHMITLLKSVPPVSAPRSYALTPEMAGISTRSRVLAFPLTTTFTAISAAAAVILVVIGVSLLSGGARSAAPGSAANVAMLANTTAAPSPAPGQGITTETTATLTTQPPETSGRLFFSASPAATMILNDNLQSTNGATTIAGLSQTGVELESSEPQAQAFNTSPIIVASPSAFPFMFAASPPPVIDQQTVVAQAQSGSIQNSASGVQGAQPPMIAPSSSSGGAAPVPMQPSGAGAASAADQSIAPTATKNSPPTATQAPTDTPTHTATATDTASPSHTPTVTASPSSTATATASATSAPAPTSTSTLPPAPAPSSTPDTGNSAGAVLVGIGVLFALAAAASIVVRRRSTSANGA